MQKKVVDKNKDKEEQKEFAEFWKIRNEELSIAEQQEKEETRLRNVQLANYVKTQSDWKK